MLEIRRALFVLRRWWWVPVGAGILGAAIAYLVTKVLIQQQYEATSLVAIAPPPQGPNGLYLTTLAASADAQLVPTLGTARAARALLPPAVRSGVGEQSLSGDTASTASLEGQLLYITVRWHDSNLVPILANSVANAFIGQEKTRLERRYEVIDAVLKGEEARLTGLMGSVSGGGQARSWLQSQYADTLSKIYQQDADARIQASIQEMSLQLAQPAYLAGVAKVGPKASTNGALGGALAFLIALVLVFVANGTYGEDEQAPAHPVLKKVGD